MAAANYISADAAVAAVFTKTGRWCLIKGIVCPNLIFKPFSTHLFHSFTGGKNSIQSPGFDRRQRPVVSRCCVVAKNIVLTSQFPVQLDFQAVFPFPGPDRLPLTSNSFTPRNSLIIKKIQSPRPSRSARVVNV